MNTAAVNSYVIKAGLYKRAVASVTVVRQNPVDISNLAIGQPAAAVPDVLSRVLAVCAAAQRAAAMGAIETATGVTPDAETLRQRATGVLAERLINGVWRLAIDWPRALKRPEKPSVVAAVRRALASGTVPPADIFAELDTASLAEAMQPVAADVPLLLERITQAISDPIEALQTLETLGRCATVSPEWSGTEGRVRTSRGILLHHAGISDGRITTYTMQTPTDNAMAPANIEAAFLGLGGPDLEDKAVTRLALIDPCAPVTIIFGEAANA